MSAEIDLIRNGLMKELEDKLVILSIRSSLDILRFLGECWWHPLALYPKERGLDGKYDPSVVIYFSNKPPRFAKTYENTSEVFLKYGKEKQLEIFGQECCYSGPLPDDNMEVDYAMEAAFSKPLIRDKNGNLLTPLPAGSLEYMANPKDYPKASMMEFANFIPVCQPGKF
jgi:hypothetical protein